METGFRRMCRMAPMPYTEAPLEMRLTQCSFYCILKIPGKGFFVIYYNAHSSFHFPGSRLTCPQRRCSTRRLRPRWWQPKATMTKDTALIRTEAKSSLRASSTKQISQCEPVVGLSGTTSLTCTSTIMYGNRGSERVFFRACPKHWTRAVVAPQKNVIAARPH